MSLSEDTKYLLSAINDARLEVLDKVEDARKESALAHVEVEKRIARLEAARNRAIGAIAVLSFLAGCIGGILEALISKLV